MLNNIVDGTVAVLGANDFTDKNNLFWDSIVMEMRLSGRNANYTLSKDNFDF